MPEFSFFAFFFFGGGVLSFVVFFTFILCFVCTNKNPLDYTFFGGFFFGGGVFRSVLSDPFVPQSPEEFRDLYFVEQFLVCALYHFQCD